MKKICLILLFCMASHAQQDNISKKSGFTYPDELITSTPGLCEQLYRDKVQKLEEYVYLFLDYPSSNHTQESVIQEGRRLVEDYDQKVVRFHTFCQINQ